MLFTEVDGEEIALALDVAATEFHQDGTYRGRSFGGAERMTSEELTARYSDWLERYKLLKNSIHLQLCRSTNQIRLFKKQPQKNCRL